MYKKRGFTLLEIKKYGGGVKDEAEGAKGGSHMHRRQKFVTGFTLIELVMVIVVLAILAAVAIPKYYDLQQKAKAAAEAGVVGGVRAGIVTYFVNVTPIPKYPDTLDGKLVFGECNQTSACFGNVLSQGGITEGWTKNAEFNYTGPNNGIYLYENVTGSFLLQ